MLRNQFLVAVLLVLGSVNPVLARNSLHIVGSSTVYPFARQVIDTLDRHPGDQPAKVESTGSGGGFQLFCGGNSLQYPDIANASRRIKKSEYDLCMANGVTRIVEIKIGYDGIVLATAKRAEPLRLSLTDIFLALAARVPARDGSGTVIANPFTSWREVNPSLPLQPIRVLGPPPTSGTRDAFEELAMESGCQKFSWVHDLKKKDKMMYREICRNIRQDGAYVNAGENDGLIVRQISADQGVIGIFGFSYLAGNRELIDGAILEGVRPTFENIATGAYPVSRPLYFYVNAAHVDQVPAIGAYLQAFTEENSWGPDGYLTTAGLIPLPEKERALYRDTARGLTLFKMQ